MTRSLRRAHLWIWLVATPAIVAILIVAMMLRASRGTEASEHSAPTAGPGGVP